MKIDCYVVDDEKHAIEALSDYINQTPGWNLVGTETRPLHAFQEITSKRVKPDVTFLDIDMPKLSGMQLSELIRPHTEIIFSTAYPSYALPAFERNALDYLLKPITYERFLKTVSRAQEILRAKKIQPVQEYFFIHSDKKSKMLKINTNEISYIQGLSNYIQLHTVSGNIHTIYISMKELSEKLPYEQFFRTHRSFIVNINQVELIQGNGVILKDKTHIPLGVAYKEEFLKKIN